MNEELHALVWGRVQGVWFRQFVTGHATALGVDGWVRNREDGVSVEVMAQGGRTALETLLAELYRGPPDAHVDRVEPNWRSVTSAAPRGFRVLG